MNTRFTGILGTILVAITVAAAAGVAEAAKGGRSAQGGGFGTGNGAMYGPGPATGHGFEQRNDNQYRYRYQHQHRNRDGGAVSAKPRDFDSGAGRYSDDRYLSQQDFEGWLNQQRQQTASKKQPKQREQASKNEGI